MTPAPVPPADRQYRDEPFAPFSSSDNEALNDSAEIATWLLLRPDPRKRQPLAAPVLEQLWSWSADEARREAFCQWFNQHTGNLGHQHTLIELVRESQLQLSVAIRAALHGEVKVRELAPDLFAIIGPPDCR